jgi:multiple sugar transport system ATP-binding protein
MAKVVLENVGKTFKDTKGNLVKAVESVNLTIDDEEFMVFVGPSGCGKSTTLRMIAGLEEITEGTIQIDGKLINSVPPKDRDIAMVFQNYALYPHMSVYKNMAFGLQLRKYPKQEIEKRVSEAAEILGITNLLERKPKELSGGQRQRVAVGRAIVRKPKAFLFDEPLSNLDAKMRVQMRTEISKLHTRLSATMIYVTHDQVEAMTMGDRICVMNEGKVQQVAEPLEIYNEPKNRFVAGFIGSPPMNFIRGTLKGEGGKIVFVERQGKGSAPIRLEVEEPKASKMQSHIGKEVIFGIRPEDIQDKLFVSADATPGRITQAVTEVVEVVEPMGAEVYLYLNSSSHSFVARVPTHEKSEVNLKMDLVFNMKRAHFFDVTTEETIV